MAIEQTHAAALVSGREVLTRYWIEYDWPKRESPAFGTEEHNFGVTAHDLEDALRLVHRRSSMTFSLQPGVPSPNHQYGVWSKTSTSRHFPTTSGRECILQTGAVSGFHR